MGKVEQRILQLYELFQEKKKVTSQDIEEAFGVNRQSANNYLNRFKAAGYHVKKEIKDKRAYFYLDEESSEETPYSEITKDVIRMFLIAHTLHKMPCTQKELRDKFKIVQFELRHRDIPKEESYKDYKEYSQYLNEISRKIDIDIERTQFDKLVRHMIESEELYLDPATKKLYPTGKEIPILIPFSTNEEDAYFRLYDNLGTIVPAHPHYKQLKSIREHQCMFLGDLEDGDFEDFIIYGRKYITFETINHSLALLNTTDFQNKVIHIIHTTKKGTEADILFATGLLVYVTEKDKLYLMGKIYNPKQNTTSYMYILDAATIQFLEKTNYTHDCFRDSIFTKQYETMFSISTQEPIYVEVHFDNIFNIETKVRQLAAHRPQANIELKNNTIVYTDYVSGLNDFANYLRRYGKSCHVIQPLELKEHFKNSVVRSLERYEVNCNA